MSETSWQQTAESYKPTVLLGRLPERTMQAAIAELSDDGWDVRIAPYLADAGSDTADTASLAGAARAIQPDLVVAAGTEVDPWAFGVIRAIRSDLGTSDVGLVVLAAVSVPADMDVTPMSGPDRWIFGDEDPRGAVDQIRDVMSEALEDRLEWARRDWTPVDRRRYGMKSLSLRVEMGQPITPALLAEALYGPHYARVDVKTWDGPPHRPGWRYGAEEQFQRPLLIHAQRILLSDGEMDEQQFVLYSRNAALIIAAAHRIVTLTGGWPTIE